MNTTGNSRPFAECRVMSVTALWSGSSASRSVTSETASRNACTRSIGPAAAAGAGAGPIGIGRRQPADAATEARSPESSLSSNWVRHPDQLLQVLDAPLRLDRPLGSQLGEVAGALEHGFDRVPDPAVGLVGDLVEEIEQVADAAQRPSR